MHQLTIRFLWSPAAEPETLTVVDEADIPDALNRWLRSLPVADHVVDLAVDTAHQAIRATFTGSTDWVQIATWATTTLTLVDAAAAALAARTPDGRPRPEGTIRRWAHHGLINRYGTGRAGRVLYSVDEVCAVAARLDAHARTRKVVAS